MAKATCLRLKNKMKKALYGSVIILLVAGLRAQETCPRAALSKAGCAAPDRSAILQIAEAWTNSYNRGDATKVASLYTQDAYYLTQHFVSGIVRGRSNIQAYVQRGVDGGYRINSINLISVECSGNFAYAVGRYDSTNAGQKAFGVNLVVLRKMKGRWLIAAHEAAVPDPATAIQSLKNPAKQ